MVARQRQRWSGDIDPGEFRGICQEVIAAAADYHAYLSGRGVLPNFTPREVRALFAKALSEEDESAGALLAGWRELAGRHPVYSEKPTEMEAL